MTDVDAMMEPLEDLAERVGGALDLAIAADAPLGLVDRLATAKGLLNALEEIPRHALAPHASSCARKALAAWHGWQGRAAPKAAA